MAEKTDIVDPKLTPSEYFAALKNAKQNVSEEMLRNSYNVILRLADKYRITGQKRSLDKLKFLTQCLVEEEKLIPLGITTFIYRDVIEDIDKVENNTVKIIELSNYMREVPDEIAVVVEKTKDIFNEFYVVFTDYTGKEERRVEQEHRDKDPILFGCFTNNEFVSDRFYFLGDWVDEYCDLTLDKLVDVYRKNNDGIYPTHLIEVPQTSEELLDILKAYNIKGEPDNQHYMFNGINANSVLNYVSHDPDTPEKKKSFFDRIRTIFSNESKS